MGNWYRVTKKINGRLYDYWQKTYRQGRSVKTMNKYIGPAQRTVYHGTLEQFDTFSEEKAGSNTGWKNARFGTFFIDDPARAKAFVEENKTPGDDRTAIVKQARIDFKNPIDLTPQGIFTKAKQAPTVVRLLGGEEMSPREALEYLNDNIGLGEMGDLHDALYGDVANKELIRQAGHDGIISQFGKDDEGNTIKEYCVFNTEQITLQPQEQSVGLLPKDVFGAPKRRRRKRRKSRDHGGDDPPVS